MALPMIDRIKFFANGGISRIPTIVTITPKKQPRINHPLLLMLPSQAYQK
jgi:hypothetical protein